MGGGWVIYFNFSGRFNDKRKKSEKQLMKSLFSLTGGMVCKLFQLYGQLMIGGRTKKNQRNTPFFFLFFFLLRVSAVFVLFFGSWSFFFFYHFPFFISIYFSICCYFKEIGTLIEKYANIFFKSCDHFLKTKWTLLKIHEISYLKWLNTFLITGTLWNKCVKNLTLFLFAKIMLLGVKRHWKICHRSTYFL